MGANFSSCVCDGDSAPMRPRLGDIPENCMALVLMYLDPPDICKLARLNKAFHDASFADFIWESKLPLNYKFIMGKALELEDTSITKLGKKDIYARLCRPNLFDNGTKVIKLCKYILAPHLLFKCLVILYLSSKCYFWFRKFG